ncbi:MAG: hypothetical protein F6J90_06770 [Moorea sp. SIOASIH]|nr:hypothetical protein [Moorena sp. SIOASIH]
MRYGADYPNPGDEAENQWQPFGGALRGGLSQPWGPGGKSVAAFWWCVTGRTIPTLGTRRKIRASPPLTHPTHYVTSTFNLGQKATLREQPVNLGQKATLREQPVNLGQKATLREQPSTK